MTLTERASSLFGRIAVESGRTESDTGRRPLYVLMTQEDADMLLAYYETTKPMCSSSVINRQTAQDRLVMVSGLEVHIIRGRGTLRVA